MHCSSEGVLVQKVWGEEVLEVGGVMEGSMLELSTLCTLGESIVLTLGRYELEEFTMGGG